MIKTEHQFLFTQCFKYIKIKSYSILNNIYKMIQTEL